MIIRATVNGINQVSATHKVIAFKPAVLVDCLEGESFSREDFFLTVTLDNATFEFGKQYDFVVPTEAYVPEDPTPPEG